MSKDLTDQKNIWALFSSQLNPFLGKASECMEKFPAIWHAQSHYTEVAQLGISIRARQN